MRALLKERTLLVAFQKYEIVCVHLSSWGKQTHRLDISMGDHIFLHEHVFAESSFVNNELFVSED